MAGLNQLVKCGAGWGFLEDSPSSEGGCSQQPEVHGVGFCRGALLPDTVSVVCRGKD